MDRIGYKSWLVVWFVCRKQQVFIQRGSSKTCWSEEEEQAEEEPPGASASLQTTPSKTYSLTCPALINTKYTLNIWTLKNRGCLQVDDGAKGNLMLLCFFASVFTVAHSVSKCFVCLCTAVSICMLLLLSLCSLLCKCLNTVLLYLKDINFYIINQCQDPNIFNA